MNILVAMETKPYQRVWLEEAAPGKRLFIKRVRQKREDVQNADIILGNVSPKLISTGDKLKWLQTDSAGVDGYIHGCLPKETVLTNATGAYGLAISEYMVAVWLELLKKAAFVPRCAAHRQVVRPRAGALGVELDGAGARPRRHRWGICEACESAGRKGDRRAPHGYG